MDPNNIDLNNIDTDALDKIGNMMGHDRDTMNKVKQMMKNPEAMKQVKRMMNQQLNKLNGNKDEQKPEQKKVGRNESCPCGSGKKYKKCCLP